MLQRIPVGEQSSVLDGMKATAKRLLRRHGGFGELVPETNEELPLSGGAARHASDLLRRPSRCPRAGPLHADQLLAKKAGNEPSSGSILERSMLGHFVGGHEGLTELPLILIVDLADEGNQGSLY